MTKEKKQRFKNLLEGKQITYVNVHDDDCLELYFNTGEMIRVQLHHDKGYIEMEMNEIKAFPPSLPDQIKS